ncbi:MAG: hypothetical protein AB2L14_18245 [Candidatus Xenobiia bacterium LiM19]
MAGHRLPELLKKRGAAMAMLLVVIAIAAILAFTLAGGSIFHLTVATKEANGADARNLAESAIAQCISNVMADTSGAYGKSNETIVVIKNQDPSAAAGVITSFLADVPAAVVTFNKTAANSNSLPFSFNNLDSTNASSDGWNGKVPGSSMQIIAAGKSCGTTKYLEAILQIPPFPYCIATSGKFISSGDLLVASVGTDSSQSDLTNTIDKTKAPLPGHVLSNNGADDSVTLNGKGKITGDVQTVGDVKMGPSSTVEILGEVRSRYDPIDMPAIEITKYDPKDKTGVKNLATLLDKPTLQGFNRVDGTLNVTGNMALDGALLYVTGSLNVGGGVSGKGALVVLGSTTIGGGVSLASDNLVALLCNGNISITGSGASSSSSFQGLVYGKGNFTARDISVCGYFINSGGTNSQISLSNVTFVHVPEYSSIAVSTKKESEDIILNIFDDTFSESLANNEKYKEAYEEYKTMLNQVKDQIGESKLNEIRKFFKDYGPKFTIKQSGKDKYDFYIDDKLDTESVAVDDIAEKMQYFAENELDPYLISKYGEEFFAAQYVVPIAPYSVTFHNAWDNFLNNYPASLVAGGGVSSGTGGSTETVPVFSFDLNEFLRDADRMKVVLWREIDSPQK